MSLSTRRGTSPGAETIRIAMTPLPSKDFRLPERGGDGAAILWIRRPEAMIVLRNVGRGGFVNAFRDPPPDYPLQKIDE